jgi:phosphoribosylamine-glycine ligase
MKVLVISRRGRALALAHAMQQDGAEVWVYVHEREARGLFDGMLENRLPTPEKLVKYAKGIKDHVVVFDEPRVFDRDSEDDRDLTKILDDGSKDAEMATRARKALFGAIADRLAQHNRVVGMSTNTEGLMLNRTRQARLAEKLFIDAVPMYDNEAALGARTWVNSHPDERWVLKPHGKAWGRPVLVEAEKGDFLKRLTDEYWAHAVGDGPATIEPYAPGRSFTHRAWWNGEKFVNPSLTVSCSGVLGRGCGPRYGTELTLTWPAGGAKRFPFDSLAQTLRNAGYIGPVGAKLREGVLVGLDFSIASDATLASLLYLHRRRPDDYLRDFLTAPRDTVVTTTRVGAWGYPFASHASTGIDLGDKLQSQNRIWMNVAGTESGLRTTGVSGLLFLAVGTGPDPESAFVRGRSAVTHLDVPDHLHARTDWDHLCKDWHRWRVMEGLV